MGTLCEAVPTNSLATSSLIERSSAVSVRPSVALGLAQDFAFATLAVGGFFSYDSNAPGFSGATSATIGADGPPKRASIEYGRAFAYGGSLSLRMPIY